MEASARKERHEYSALWPDMTGEEFSSLVNSMDRSGFRPDRPILLAPDGTILDGWQRYEASLVAGVDPVFVTTKATTDAAMLDEVEALNEMRRYPNTPLSLIHI